MGIVLEVVASNAGRRPLSLPEGLDPQARLAMALTASVFRVDAGQIAAPTRLQARVAMARQVAMYVSHVTLGLSLSEVGRRFGRDRTTAGYACALVEDLRDDMRFDRTIGYLEAATLKLDALAVRS